MRPQGIEQYQPERSQPCAFRGIERMVELQRTDGAALPMAIAPLEPKQVRMSQNGWHSHKATMQAQRFGLSGEERGLGNKGQGQQEGSETHEAKIVLLTAH